MDIYLFFALFLAAGILSAVGLSLLRRKLSLGQYNWPLYLFLALLGAAANNTAAVLFAGGDAFLPSGGGLFGGDNLTATVSGLMLALFAVPGIVASLFFLQKPVRLGPVSGWVWGWLLMQGMVSCGVLFLGIWPNYDTIPLALYVPLMTAFLLVVALVMGYRWSTEDTLGLRVPLVGGGLFALLALLLAVGMRTQAHIDPAWGLDLTQTSCGLWYTRLNLPAAVLVGDYQYDWDFTAPLFYFSALAPSVLLTAGWLGGRAMKLRTTGGDRYAETA